LTEPNLYELWRLRLFSFSGHGLALAALALVVFGAIECPHPMFGIYIAIKQSSMQENFPYNDNNTDGLLQSIQRHSN